MKNLPTWAVWSIVVPLSPVITLLPAILSEAVICDTVDARAPAGLALGAGAAGLVLLRKLRVRVSQDV